MLHARRLRQGKAAMLSMLLRQTTSLILQLPLHESENQRRRSNNWIVLGDKQLRQTKEVGGSKCRDPIAREICAVECVYVLLTPSTFSVIVTGHSEPPFHKMEHWFDLIPCVVQLLMCYGMI